MGLPAKQIRRFLKPPKPHITSLIRRLCAEPDHSPPPPRTPPQRKDSSASIHEVVSLLQTTSPNDWLNNPDLQSLISGTTLSPLSLFKITRELGDSQKAINFFNYLKVTQKSHPKLLSCAFEAVLEHSMREYPSSPLKFYELFLMVKDQDIPLSFNSAIILIRRLGEARMLKEVTTIYEALDTDVRNTHVRNVVLDCLFKSGSIDDALKLLDEMLKPGSDCLPNNNTFNIAFRAILKRNWSGREVNDNELYELVVGFGKQGFWNDYWLSQVITRFCRGGKCNNAWELVHEMMSLGIRIEVGSCNALLAGLGRMHNFDRMNLLMSNMKDNDIKPDAVTFGILINHLCKFRRVDDALAAFEKMKQGEFSVEPDIVVYNTLIDGLCKVGRQEEGLELMARIRSDGKYEPNVVTFNCLIDGFCKVGEIEKGLELFERMKKEGLEPNVVTLNTLLDGMCKNGRVSSAMELFSQMKDEGLGGNAITYTILITAFCSANNIDKAKTLFDEMLDRGCSADAVVYYSLISGLSQAGRMDDASFVVSKLKERGFRLDNISYNILLGGYCRKNKLEKAQELIKYMEEDGVKPDRVTYNTLISYFSSKGDFTCAHRTMKKMMKDGYTPNVVTYGALIHAYCSVGYLDYAMKIFRDMNSSSKVPPNTVIYNMLIDSLCKNDKVEEAISLMEDMKDRGAMPNTTTYNAMFKGLQQKNWLDKALEMMDQMTENACKPDYITMEVLTEWLSAVGQTNKLSDFVQGYEVSTSNGKEACSVGANMA